MKKKNDTGKKSKKITTAEFDKIFDEGGSVDEYLVPNSAVISFRVNVDFPPWMVRRLDQEADRLGISRQALIKVWIGDRISQLEKPKDNAPPLDK